MRETVKLGSKGEDVKFLQKFLGLKADGDFGKKTDAAVKEFQKKKGLTCDGVVGPKTWEAIENYQGEEITEPNSEVVYNPINVHISKSKNREIKYLVIHYTAGSSSKGDSELKTRNVFLKRSASADFVVDDDTMLQVNPDPRNYYCWAVGDGSGKYGITNKNSISIEICSTLEKGTNSSKPNHEGWSFSDAAVDNAVKLSKMLMKEYNIPIDRVVRHYDASRKLCPGILGWNPGPVYDAKTGAKTKKTSTEEKWHAFKKRLE